MNELRREQRFALPPSGVPRRTVALGVLGGGLLSALPWSLGRPDVPSRAIAGTDEPGPDRYVLRAGEREIVFRPGPRARLDYRDVTGSRSFAGDELAYERIWPFGWTATVLLEEVHDGYDRYLTLLVPEVNPDETEPSVSISTVALVITHWTTDGGQILVEGAIQTYEAVTLEGTADFGSDDRAPRHRSEAP